MADVVTEDDLAQSSPNVVSDNEITDVAEPAQKSLYLKDKGVSVSYDSSLSPEEVKDSVVSGIYEKDKYPVVPKEGRMPFIKSVASKFHAAYLDTAAEFYKTAGMVQKVSPLGQVAKWAGVDLTTLGEDMSTESQKKREQAKQDNGFAQFGSDLIGSVGGLPLAIPEAIIMGEATIGAAASEMGGIGESLLTKIGPFAVGAGEMGAAKASREGKGPVGIGVAAIESGAMAKIWSEAKPSSLIPLTALGEGDVWYQALSQGRIPTKDEQLQGMASSLAYSLAFMAIPGLKKLASFDAEKSQLGYSYDTITKHIEDGNIDGVKEELNN